MGRWFHLVFTWDLIKFFVKELDSCSEFMVRFSEAFFFKLICEEHRFNINFFMTNFNG